MSLYRKYRPQTFEDVVGQDHVARTLRNALTANPPRVAHAYLFTGPRGIGKTTNARLLAKCLNCENGPTPTPCNKCDFCTRVALNQPVMDLTEIDAASNTGVDNVRETIIDKVSMAPAQGRYRVTIIDEVHMLSTSAFNALLKTLEEPPAHAIFILATTDVHKVPQTVLSRCQRFDFRRVTPVDIAARLQHVAQSENLVLEEDAARLIARHADGALRDALTLLEQVSAFSAEEITASDVRLVVGGVPQELLDELLESVTNGDAHATLSLLERAVDEGASFGQLARDLTSYARDLMLLTVGFDGDSTLSDAERATRLRQANNMGRARLESLITHLREAEKEMRQSSDHRLLLELTLVRAGSNTLVSSTPAQPALRSVPMNGTQPAFRQPPPVAKEVSSTNGSAPKVVDETPKPFVDERVPNVEEPAKPFVDEAPASIDEAETPVSTPETTIDETPVVREIPTQPVGQKRGRRITNLEEMIELWPKLLMRIRTKIGVTAVAYLHDARPVGFSDEDVTLEFSKEFHHAKALEASKRLPFEEKINEVLDKPRRVKFVLAAPKAEIAPVPDEPEPEDDDEFGAEQDILAFTQSMFGADIMGRSG